MFPSTGFKPAFGGSTSTFGSTSGFNPTSTGAFGSTPASSFGGSGTTAPAFGSTFGAGGAVSGGGLFGGATSGGVSGAPSTPAFGANSSFGGSTFGSAPTTMAFGGSAPAFGASAVPFGSTSTPSFGSSSTGFGVTSTPAFGAGAGAGAGINKPAFGATSPSTGFGAQATGGVFGSTPSFGGSSASSPFSSLNKTGSINGGFQTTASVSSGLSNWGQQPKLGTTSPGQNMGFGSSATPFNTMNSSNSFGGGMGAFGGLNKPGGTTSPVTFGAGITRSATTPANMFGPASGAVSGGGFGMMGQPQVQQQTTAFGIGGTSGMGGGGGFMSGFQSQQQQSVGTGNPMFTPQQIQDNIVKNNQNVKVNLNLQAITAMPPYANKSFEELRLEDYKKGNKGGSSSVVGLGGFGATSSTAKPLFGSSTMGTTPGFGTGTPSFGSGATGSSPFGATAPSFGATAVSNVATQPFGGSFGSSAAAQPFTFASASTGNMFGSSSPAPAASTPAFGFGQQQTQPQQTAFSTGFGAASSTPSMFGGASSAPNMFGAATSTPNMFGAATSTPNMFGAASSTPSMFGASTSAQPSFGASPTATGGMFSGKPLGGSGFGAAQTSSFGSTFNTQPTANSGFGAQNPGFHSTAGSTQQANQFQLGNSTQSMFSPTPSTAPSQQQSFGSFSNFGAPTQQFSWGQQPGLQQQQQQLQQQQPQQQQPQQVQLDVSQKIDFLLKKKDELVSSHSISNATTTASGTASGNDGSKPVPSFNFTGFSGDVNFLGVPISHRSAARVIPRGIRPLNRSKSIPNSTNKSVTNLTGDSLNSSDWPSRQSKPSASNTLESLSSPDLMYLGRNAKKLIIAPSPVSRGDSSHSATQRDDKPDVTEGLPPHNLLKMYPAPTLGLTDTPAKADNSFATTSIAEQTTACKVTLTPGQGDATGLTPAGPISTPSFDEKTSNREEGGSMRLVYQSSPHVVANHPPTLTLDGYCTVPDMEVLKMFSNSELSKVKNFSVCREKFGMIKWEGVTDVRGLNLDNLIRIDKKEVFVYEGVDTPPVGKELNKEAIITLWDVFPKGNKSDDHAKFEAKLRKFCEMNDADYLSYSPASGEWVFAVKHFSRYGLDDSDDDEDGQYNSNNLPSQESKVNQTDRFKEQYMPLNKSTLDMEIDSFPSEGVDRLRSILQGYVNRATVFQSPSHSEHGLIDETFRSPVNSALEKEDHRRSLYTTISPKFLGTSEPFTIAHIPSIDFDQLHNCSDPPPASISFSMEALSSIKADIAAEVGTAYQPQPNELHTTARLTKPAVSGRIKNYSLAMGRSFRVGWSANGCLIYPGATLADDRRPSTDRKSNPVVISKVDSLKWIRTVPYSQSSQSIVELFEPALQAVLLFSHIEQATSLDYSKHMGAQPTVPLWRTPRATEEVTLRDEYILFVNMLHRIIANLSEGRVSRSHPDWTAFKAVQLIDALYGQETMKSFSAENFMPFYDESSTVPQSAVSFLSSEVSERRRIAFSNWIRSAVAEEVSSHYPLDDGRDGRGEGTYQRLFDLITCHRVEDAVELAEKSGLFRLSTLLSQLDGDGSLASLIQRQLELWTNNGGDLSIHPDLLRLYRLIGGDVYGDGSAERHSILSGLGWLRSIAVVYWYAGANDAVPSALPVMSTAMKNFKLVEEGGLADKPVSRFSVDSDTDGLFSLLDLLFSGTEGAVSLERRVILCLLARGFGKDLLDGRSPYLIFTVLECLNVVSNTSFAACVVRQDLIFQLLSEGQWAWAVFVALQIEDAGVRNSIAKDIILRFAGADGWEVSEGPSPTAFVIQSLSVPSQWVDEATAYRLGYLKNNVWGKVVYYLARAGKTERAKAVMCERIAPGAVLRSTVAADDLLSLLEGIGSVETGDKSNDWDDKSDMVLQYLRIFEAMKSPAGGIDQEDGDSAEAAMKVADLREIYFSAVELLRRLGRSYNDEQAKMKLSARTTEGGVDSWTSALDLLETRAMYFDMCTYLCGLVKRLRGGDLLSAAELAEDDADSAINAAPVFLESLP